MKQLFASFFFLTVLIIGPSACGLFQSCPEALPYFQIAGFDLNHYRFNDDPYGDLIVPNAKIPWEEYGLRADFKTTYYGSNETPGGAVLYALSCVEDGYQGTEVGVDTIYVVALDDYNNEFLRNDTLNRIIEVNDYFAGPTFYSLAEYLNDNRESIMLESLTIKFTEGPSEDRGLGFELIYVLTSGEQFKQQSSIVNLRQ